MRRSASGLGMVVLFVALLGLHYSLRPLLNWKSPIDFLVIAVVLVSVRVRPGVAAVVGLLSGIVADALAPSSFGSAALALTVVAFAGSWLKASFFAEHIFLNAAFLFLAKLGFDTIFLLTEGRIGGSRLLLQLGWSSVAAVVTAIAGLALLVLFRPLVDVEGERA